MVSPEEAATLAAAPLPPPPVAPSATALPAAVLSATASATSTAPSADADEALLDHLDALYGFAQLVSQDAEAAARLVRDTYTRAFATPLPHGLAAAPHEARAWLYRLLLDERRASRDSQVALALVDDDEDLQARRFALSATLVERLLPAALLALPSQLRLMLVLCDVEGLACEDAAEVVGMEDDEACAALVEAQETLVANIRGAAALHEVPILDRMLEVPGGMRRALAEALERELDPLPPTLRPTIPLPERRAQVPVSEGMRQRRLWPYALALALAATAAVVYVQRRPPEASAEDLVEVTADDASAATPTTPLSEREGGEAYALDNAGWRLALPTVRGYRLSGASMRDVAPDVSVPVFHYASEDSAAGAIVVYAYTYRLLDIARDRLALDPAILAGLEDERHSEQIDLGGAAVLVWRSRDDVFVAVAPPGTTDLAERIER